ncbi:hypothetical protein LX36DRAFT_657057 [Colletotrichum falcatum]|nr:hypothetical protein LX36DRAFT_657057 [Colletotrichum falcatum]
MSVPSAFFQFSSLFWLSSLILIELLLLDGLRVEAPPFSKLPLELTGEAPVLWL